jgi:hypothetical protein
MSRGQFISAKVVSTQTDPEVYHQQAHGIGRGHPEFVMSRSELCVFLACPSRWVKGYRSDETESTEWGTLLDILVLDIDRRDEKIAVKPETYTNAKGEVKPWHSSSTEAKEWKAHHEGMLQISREEFDEAIKAKNRLLGDPKIREFLRCSEYQVMVVAEWQHTLTTTVVPVKILLDLVPGKDHPEFGKSLGDFKTARSAQRKAFQRQAFALNYHVQAALYRDVYMVARPEEDRQEFRHVISENVSPYEPGRRWIDSELESIGRETYLRALDLYCQCLAANHWPGYDDVANDMIAGWGQVGAEAWQLKEALE